MTENPVFARIETAIKTNDIVLYMKGSKKLPQCGFSATVAAVLERLGISEAAVGDRQVFEVGAQRVGEAGRVAAQHGRRKIERDQLGRREGAGEAGQRVAGAAAGVENAPGCEGGPRRGGGRRRRLRALKRAPVREDRARRRGAAPRPRRQAAPAGTG